MFALYNVLLILFSPVWLVWMVLRMRKRSGQADFRERCGKYGFDLPRNRRRVWIHAVSVGEVVAALPILRILRSAEPPVEIVLSVTTPTGHQTATDQAAGLYDHLIYFPIDIFRFVVAAIIRIKPAVIAIMETELWFNFLYAAKRMRIPAVLINARISNRSYPRMLKLRFFYSRLLSLLDAAYAQTDEDARRLTSLGAMQVETLGNCKFDQAAQAPKKSADEWRAELGIAGDTRVLVIGSTRGEEDEAFVFAAISQLKIDHLHVVHAPRHLERSDAIAAQAAALGYQVGRRSLGEQTPYLILDTFGELGEVFQVADVVIIGGGFAALGGQNILQPLALGKPVLHGIHMDNFSEIAAGATAIGASIACSTPTELAEQADRLFRHSEARSQMAAGAKSFIEPNLGASQRYAEQILVRLKA